MDKIALDLIQGILTPLQLYELATNLYQLKEHGFGYVSITFINGHIDCLLSSKSIKLTKDNLKGE